MHITPTDFDETFLIQLRPHIDERGSFTRVFSQDIFRKHGLGISFPEHSVARNTRIGVLRGLHYQAEPYGEVKVIRCAVGHVFDVLVDMRPSSKTFGRWISFDLDAAKNEMLYVPAGIAHGYQTLSDISQIEYLISEIYNPATSCGIKWNSEALAIPWPIADPILSDRDRSHPAFIP